MLVKKGGGNNVREVERTRYIFKGYGSIIRFAGNKDCIVVAVLRFLRHQLSFDAFINKTFAPSNFQNDLLPPTVVFFSASYRGNISKLVFVNPFPLSTTFVLMKFIHVVNFLEWNDLLSWQNRSFLFPYLLRNDKKKKVQT